MQTQHTTILVFKNPLITLIIQFILFLGRHLPLTRSMRKAYQRCANIHGPTHILETAEERLPHIDVYSVTVMTHVKALQAGHSSQGTSEPITPV